jgi:hypothetical protein
MVIYQLVAPTYFKGFTMWDGTVVTEVGEIVPSGIIPSDRELPVEPGVP